MNRRYGLAVLAAVAVMLGMSVAPCRGQGAAGTGPASREMAAWLDHEGRAVTPDANGILTLERQGALASLHKTFRVALDQTPVVRIRTANGRTPWRLTGRAGEGPEIVLADFQMEGTCRRNLARRLGVSGAQDITLTFRFWGWSSTVPRPKCRLRLAAVEFVPEESESEADDMAPDLSEYHARLGALAKGIALRVPGHPRLRWRQEQVPALRRRAQGAWRPYLGPLADILADLEAHKAKPKIRLEDLTGKTRYPHGGMLLSVQPPDAPPPGNAAGSGPFGATPEAIARPLQWHSFSHWHIGAALSDDPVWVGQLRAWTLAWVGSRFWLAPDYVYFDFGTAYPLQCLALGYDGAFATLSPAERQTVRDAMGALAHGLYLNGIHGYGSINGNDPRGNHTAATYCGLGWAGLALLGEHPEAPLWVALAETMLEEAFNEHTSGAWTESPSYGAYGVQNWLKLCEALENVAGRNHFDDPFLRKFAEYQLMISDWDGRDLGYNQGGEGQYWNQWVFYRIARSFRDPRFQWLGSFLGGSGYGDAFWWVDPALAPQRPAPAPSGAHYADVGLSVWRDGWETNATILLHHCGRKGQHKERNMNHVTLYARGARVLPDGRGTGTKKHNVPVMGGQEQNLYGPGQTLAFHSDENGGYALGDATPAYPGARRVRRHVLFLRPALIAIIDDIDVGPKPRDVVYRLNPVGEVSAAPNGAGFRVTNGNCLLLGATVLPDGQALASALVPFTKTSSSKKSVEATLNGEGATRAVTLLAIEDPANSGAALSVAKAGSSSLDLRAGDRAYKLGFAPASLPGGVRPETDLWLAELGAHSVLRVLTVADAGSSRGTAALQTPAGRLSGKTAVSWAAGSR